MNGGKNVRALVLVLPGSMHCLYSVALRIGAMDVAVLIAVAPGNATAIVMSVQSSSSERTSTSGFAWRCEEEHSNTIASCSWPRPMFLRSTLTSYMSKQCGLRR